MKTPREILLARHQATAPKLDAIRQSTVAAVCDRRNFADTAVTDRRYNHLPDNLAGTHFALPPDLDGAGGGLDFDFHRQHFAARRHANHHRQILAFAGNNDDVSRPAEIAERIIR